MPITKNHEPIQCPTCDRPEDHPNPALLVAGCIVDCPFCGPSPAQADGVDNIRRDVHEIFAEESRRGDRRGGTGSRSAKKPRPQRREAIRFEQDSLGFAERDAVRVRRLATPSRAVKLTLPDVLLEPMLKLAKRANMSNGATIRFFVRSYGPELGDVSEIVRGTHTNTLQVRLGEAEVLVLDAAAEHFGRTRSEVAAAALAAGIADLEGRHLAFM